MKVPPKKPHFLKPILPGFKDKFKIPKGFLKYLKGYDHIEHAILKRTGKKWLVKLNGRGLEDGWKKFAEELNLQLGDLLIFSHEGDMEFEVSIFDSSCCKREYGAEEKAVTREETSEEYEFKEKPNTSIESSGKVSYHTEADAVHKTFGCSHFVCTVKAYCLEYGFLYLPKHFAYENDLIAKKCGLIIKDETQRSWNLRISFCKTQTFIGDGWRKFIADNCLKKGDRIMFEVVTAGETPVWKFHFVTDGKTPTWKFHVTHAETLMRKCHEKPNTSIKSSIKACSHGKTAAHKPFVHSSFVCTIKPYCLTNGVLCVPRQFAYANGLIANKKYDLIVKDGTQRSWNLRISCCKIQVFIIGEGCRKFIADSCLKEGDHIMFEVVTNGETPIWKFHVITSANTPMRKFHEKPNTSIKSSIKASSHGKAAAHKPFLHSSFVFTIKPYCLTYGLLHIPRDFAYANGLIANKKYDLIIKDETQRSWNLRISYSKIQVYIFGDEFRKFIADTCLKKGDHVMFEVVTDGETPIWKFHVVSHEETPMRKFRGKSNTSIKSSIEVSSHGKTAAHKPFVHSSFVCTIKSHCLTHSVLYVPKDFAYVNGLFAKKKCGLIIKDEAQRSWNLRINSSKTHVYFGEGCRKFIADNCLKEGDHIMFEVVTDEDTPIWKFHVVNDAKTPMRKFHGSIKTSDVTALKLQVAASTSANDNPHFISTIKPYALKISVVYLPAAFARSTGLMDRRCEIIIIDEKRRSWSMWLGLMGRHFVIKKGWRRFLKANGFRIGDTYKFELINNGKIPIAYVNILGRLPNITR